MVRVVGHVLADLDLESGVPVDPAGTFRYLNQIHKCLQLQALEHEVLPSTDAQKFFFCFDFFSQPCGEFASKGLRLSGSLSCLRMSLVSVVGLVVNFWLQKIVL